MDYTNTTVILCFLCVIISRWAAVTTAQEEKKQLGQGQEQDDKCSHNAVVMAMTTCQGERQKLSYASQSNDTAQLCKALQDYSKCMQPKISGCQGPAKMAFEVITSKYATDPYNCKIGASSKLDLNNVNYKNNEASLDSADENNPNDMTTTPTELRPDPGLHDNSVIDEPDDIDEEKKILGEKENKEVNQVQNEQPYVIPSPEPSATPTTQNEPIKNAEKTGKSTPTNSSANEKPDKSFDPSENVGSRLQFDMARSFMLGAAVVFFCLKGIL